MQQVFTVILGDLEGAGTITSLPLFKHYQHFSMVSLIGLNILKIIFNLTQLG